MAKNSSIEWTHHTFNPWWGCLKVSPACDHCYAETFARRWGQSIWGKDAPRKFFGDKHWAEPLRWNAEAEADRERRRVFCASMSGVFEYRPELAQPRDRLWRLIEDTPWLDWLLLTKRPGSIKRMAPWTDIWPDNVWIGATVESQPWAAKRLPHLLALPAKVRFLSCEPLLGPLDLRDWIEESAAGRSHPLDWVIAGGESGPHARITAPQWVQTLRDQCAAHAIPFHFKQWGHWAPVLGTETKPGRRVPIESEAGGSFMAPMGKKAAGRSLDGREWNQVPLTAAGCPA